MVYDHIDSASMDYSVDIQIKEYFIYTVTHFLLPLNIILKDIFKYSYLCFTFAHLYNIP